MELKTRVWMTGNLEWFAYVDGELVFLGTREVPYPFREGDRWTNGNGVTFQVDQGSITMNSSRDGMEPDGPRDAGSRCKTRRGR